MHRPLPKPWHVLTGSFILIKLAKVIPYDLLVLIQRKKKTPLLCLILYISLKRLPKLSTRRARDPSLCPCSKIIPVCRPRSFSGLGDLFIVASPVPSAQLESEEQRHP